MYIYVNLHAFEFKFIIIHNYIICTFVLSYKGIAYIQIYTKIHIWLLHSHAHTYIHTYIHLCTYMLRDLFDAQEALELACRRVYTCVCTYVSMYLHTYIHTYIHVLH